MVHAPAGARASLEPREPATLVHFLDVGLAGVATLGADGVVRSRHGTLSEWLPEVGRSCFDSPILSGFDEDLRALCNTMPEEGPLVLPGVRLADVPSAPRCHILITWNAETGEHAVLTTIDQADRPIDHWVTQQKREQRLLEERLIVASRELERINTDLRQFTSIAAHDLQAPLRQIASFSGVLRDVLGEGLPERAGDCLDTIEGCATRLTRMIAGLLDHARLSSGRFPLEPIDLNHAVAVARENLVLEIEATGAVVMSGDLPTSVGSSVLLVNLFQNLLSNSLRYRTPGRRPTITVEAVDGPVGGFAVAVSDNGIGIPHQYAEAIFDSFARVPQSRAAGTGVGLGLSICRRIVELHGWSIALDTDYTEGSRFVIAVPVRTLSDAEPTDKAATSQRGHHVG